MTDSPSPIDSSFDISDVGTPATVIHKSIFRKEAEEEDFDLETDEDYTEQYREHDGVDQSELSSSFLVDDYSKDCDSSISAPIPKPSFFRTITKVYYHVDDENIPYTADIHVPPDCITLGDVKRKLPRTNFKYYCIALDPESGLEVKAEVRDDSQRLYPLRDGRFVLYLLTIEGSVHSDTSSGRHRKNKLSSKGSNSSREYLKAAHHFDNPASYSDSESQASSIPAYFKKAKAFNKRQAFQAHDRHHHHQLPRHKPHGRHHHNHYDEESTFDITTESDDHYRDGITYYDEDEDDSRSINTDLTSVSQVALKAKWRQQQREMRNKYKRMPSTASSTLSSITESSMGVEVITVRLNIQEFPIGMVPSILTTARGDDGGLYVGQVNPRGAVALDGRIVVGDMISEINNIDLSNYSGKEAVNILKQAVTNQPYITLTVVKTGENKKAAPAVLRNPRAEPIRPIDTNEWLKHATNAMKAMPSISEESCSTPIPDDWPTNSSASGTPFGGPPPNIHCLTVTTDKKDLVQAMMAPGSGLEIKNHEWLKILIPMSFLGKDLVDWLLDHVQGLKNRDDSCKYAGKMLKEHYIVQPNGKKKFSENCYYVVGEKCGDYTSLRGNDGEYKYAQSQTSSASGHSSNNNVFPPSMYPPPLPPSALGAHHRNSAVLNSIGSGYASMTSSPLPSEKPSNCGRTRDDQRSQTSGSSRGSSRRYVELPRKPSSLGSGSGVSDQINLDRVASRSSFRAAMSGSLRQFNIDS
ncbi:CBN-DSH-2 protein [Caenorhabditis brenneri]|uniref:CBN-DSH-2 protein n=1 Tax=Caenorhabditis brenneri TaxID=135651 RepID=G0MPT9_CAEBE|nr:CBN-DSH-2 protein [Caenorhabditis brenneri]